MSALPVRELIEHKLDMLTEEQLSNIWDYIRLIEPSTGTDDDQSHPMTGSFIKGTFTDKSEAGRDALVGFISGPTHVAEHTEEILRAEFGLKKSDDNR